MLFFVFVFVSLISLVANQDSTHRLDNYNPIWENPIENGTVAQNQPRVFSIALDGKHPLRVETFADVVVSSKELKPVLFSMRRDDTQHSWRIPSNTRTLYKNHTKTLCHGELDNGTVTITVSTREENQVPFSIKLELVQPEDFDLNYTKPPKEVEISPTKMALFHFNFSSIHTVGDTFLLNVTSLSDKENYVCSVLSVQNVTRCPEIHDLERDMRSGKGTLYQRFLGKAAIVLERSRYPKGVYVVLMAQEEDTGCYRDKTQVTESENRAMNISVSVTKLEDMQMKSTLIVLVIYFSVGLLVSTLSYCTFKTVLFEFDGRFAKQERKMVMKLKEEDHKSQRVMTNVIMALSKMKARIKNNSSGNISGKDNVDEPDTGDIPEEARRRPFVELKTPPLRFRSNPATVNDLDTETVEEGRGVVPDIQPDCQPREEQNENIQRNAEMQLHCGGENGMQTFPVVERKFTCNSLGLPEDHQSIQRYSFGMRVEKGVDEKKPRKLPWQESECETVVDGGDRAHKCLTLNHHVRTRHLSETTKEQFPCLEKIVTLNKTTIKKKRRASDVTLEDMAVRSNPEYFKNFMWQRSEQYVWNVFMIGIYYTLPVFQLVLYYQDVSLAEGNMDTCYYNFHCLYPWKNVEDFGHVFSNIGYIISGFFFILIVKNRSRKYQRFCQYISEERALGRHPMHTGIPESYGIFYAMGGALIMEGVLSGCYHICPTAENFQFDTTFMYAISVLVFLKVYQFRHPDITTTSHFVFSWIGFALVFEVVGYFTSEIFFWVLFLFIYVVFVIVFVIHVHTHATGPNLRKRCSLLWKTIKQCDFNFSCIVFDKKTLARLLPTIVIILTNLGLATYIAVMRTVGVSRYLLVIMMLNMMIYILYYIGHKIYYRLKPTNWKVSEGFRVITIVYLLLSIIFMLGAVYFFIKELKSSKGTPAESRNLNEACFVLIFDNHDMWHFFSAAGLFFMFMFILTIEDYNKSEHRSCIPVF